LAIRSGEQFVAAPTTYASRDEFNMKSRETVKKLLLATAIASLFVSSALAQPYFDKLFTPEDANSGLSFNNLFYGTESGPVNNTPELQCYILTHECIATWSGHVAIITKTTFGGSTKPMRLLCGARQFGLILLAAALPGVWFLIERRKRTQIRPPRGQRSNTANEPSVVESVSSRLSISGDEGTI
jgi:hypothetical protein